MQTVAASPQDLPPIESACALGSSNLVLSHGNGFLSVVKGSTVALRIQVCGDTPTFFQAVQDTLYISFESGALRSYSLVLGILNHSVQLPYPVSGLYLQESIVVAWGAQTQVYFLNRFSLDVEKTLVLDSVPLRVCRDTQLTAVLQSGMLQGISRDGKIGLPRQLPLDSSAGELVDAACINLGRWVCLQRDKWSVVQKHDQQLDLEFSAGAPALLNTLLVSPRVSTFAILCDNGQILVVENNNVQLLEPKWEPSKLKSIVYHENTLAAVLSDTVYSSRLENNEWVWSAVEMPSLVNRNLWIVPGSTEFPIGSPIGSTKPYFVASGAEFGILGENGQLQTLYTAESPITAMYGTLLGLNNGTLVELGTPKYTASSLHRVLANPILYIAKHETTIVAASEHAVAILDGEWPTILPVESCVVGLILDNDLVYVATNHGTVVYNTVTLELVEPSPLLTVQAPSFTVVQPYVTTDLAAPLASATSPLVGFSINDSVGLFSATPTLETAAAIYTIKYAQGMPLKQADTELRQLGIPVESLESLLVELNNQNQQLCFAAAELLQSLVDNKRVETLMKQGGVRPSLIFSALEPLVPVKEWLKSSVELLFAGDTTEKLVALQITAAHGEFLEFPFKRLNELHIDSAIFRFVRTATAKNRLNVTQTLASALDTKDFKYFSLCIKCILCMVDESLISIEDPDFLVLVGAVSHSVHKTPTGMSSVRKLFTSILKKYPEAILFNKERQLLFIHSAVSNSGIVWELQNGRQLTLEGTEGHEVFKFSGDGKVIESGEDVWRLPTGLTSLFSTSNVVKPVKSETAR